MEKENLHLSLFGFTMSAGDWQRAKELAREGERYLKGLGGVPARTKGEYYTPGTSPEVKLSKNAWLPQRKAAEYLGISITEVVEMARNGKLERRKMTVSGGHSYYEYCIKKED